MLWFLARDGGSSRWPAEAEGTLDWGDTAGQRPMGEEGWSRRARATITSVITLVA
jgi:hypothetical protein